MDSSNSHREEPASGVQQRCRVMDIDLKHVLAGLH